MPTVTADSIRQQLLALLADYGVSPAEPVRETLLIREGYFCGRRFTVAGYNLVWFVEENELKLFQPDGSLSRACSANDFLVAPMRRAA